MPPERAEIVKEVDKERMISTIRWLTENTPYRLAGSRDERAASEYVSGKMAEYGLDVVNETFFTYNSTPMYSKVEILSPIQREIASLPCAHIKATPPEGEIFDLIYVGDGSFESYDNLDVAGKVVLVEVSYAPPVPEKARIASEKGAAGIVCMNWGNGEEVICNRALKSVWGNPTESTVKNIPDLVGVGITRNAGLELIDLCKQEREVRVRITAVSDRRWSEVHQPKGVLKGNGASDEFILVSSHLDAWQPGVTCNATGNATTLELCRILSKYRHTLDRDIWFVFWNGHEIAEAAGSTWFVDKYWSELNGRCAAYVNIDSTGVKDTEIFEIKSSEELHDFSFENARQFLDTDIRTMSLKKIGDQSFMGLGIPAVTQRMSFTREVMDRNHGATLGWWNHTNEDGLDKSDIDILEKDTVTTLALVLKLANAAILPYRFERNFSRIEDGLKKALGILSRHMDVSGLEKKFSAARSDVSELLEGEAAKATDKGSVQKINRYMRKVSRLLTNVFQTYAGRYDQDSYGYTKLSAPIPLFADAEKLERLDRSSMQYGMTITQLIKNRNRIDDALDELIDYTELYRSHIGNDSRKGGWLSTAADRTT